MNITNEDVLSALREMRDIMKRTLGADMVFSVVTNDQKDGSQDLIVVGNQLFRQHLAGCKACRKRFIEDMLRTIPELQQELVVVDLDELVNNQRPS